LRHHLNRKNTEKMTETTKNNEENEEKQKNNQRKIPPKKSKKEAKFLNVICTRKFTLFLFPKNYNSLSSFCFSLTSHSLLFLNFKAL